MIVKKAQRKACTISLVKRTHNTQLFFLAFFQLEIHHKLTKKDTILSLMNEGINMASDHFCAHSGLQAKLGQEKYILCDS